MINFKPELINIYALSESKSQFEREIVTRKNAVICLIKEIVAIVLKTSGILVFTAIALSIKYPLKYLINPLFPKNNKLKVIELSLPSETEIFKLIKTTSVYTLATISTLVFGILFSPKLNLIICKKIGLIEQKDIYEVNKQRIRKEKKEELKEEIKDKLQSLNKNKQSLREAVERKKQRKANSTSENFSKEKSEPKIYKAYFPSKGKDMYSCHDEEQENLAYQELLQKQQEVALIEDTSGDDDSLGYPEDPDIRVE